MATPFQIESLPPSSERESRGSAASGSKSDNHPRTIMASRYLDVCAIHQRENVFRDKYGHYLRATPSGADRKRKALTAVAAKMAGVAYAIVKHGSDYQRFFEQRIPSGSIPLARAVEASSTSEINARTFHRDSRLFSSAVKITPRRRSCVHYVECGPM